ncbi:unnamed protein product [Cladocopium goreaui]|uniref:ISWI chromatin-remodeling complex ATPase ISW2 (Imitation switch protein 2) n=1 Tax=Cladocopium goreaui TaxID=2562237 RepID=A0A9P1GR61_9DINO|nr:unnamed protein product [Cladocopium goreaui]
MGRFIFVNEQGNLVSPPTLSRASAVVHCAGQRHKCTADSGSLTTSWVLVKSQLLNSLVFVAGFQVKPQRNEDLFVYLIGTRAGGLGVNLASANHVVIFEQDWNPHVDHQAIDRAHRIGQQRKVHVHRPVQEWGIEERLVRRATNKLQMEKCIINAKEEDEEELLAESEDTLTSEEAVAGKGIEGLLI